MRLEITEAIETEKLDHIRGLIQEFDEVFPDSRDFYMDSSVQLSEREFEATIIFDCDLKKLKTSPRAIEIASEIFGVLVQKLFTE